MKAWSERIVGVLLGGGIGSLARFYLIQLIGVRWFPNFPIETLVVNLMGCLVMGTLFAIRGRLSSFTQSFLFIGLMGSFTTFSDLSYQTNSFFIEGWTGVALLNIGLSLIGGLIAFYLGFSVTSKFKKSS